MPSFTCFALGISKVKLKVLKAGHADELSRRVVEVDPLRQQVAAISEVQKTLLLLALGVLAGRGRHVPPDACTASGQKLWRAERSTRDLTPTVRNRGTEGVIR